MIDFKIETRHVVYTVRETTRYKDMVGDKGQPWDGSRMRLVPVQPALLVALRHREMTAFWLVSLRWLCSLRATGSPGAQPGKMGLRASSWSLCPTAKEHVKNPQVLPATLDSRGLSGWPRALTS